MTLWRFIKEQPATPGGNNSHYNVAFNKKCLRNVYRFLTNFYAQSTVKLVCCNYKHPLPLYTKLKNTVDGALTTLPPELKHII